PFKGSRKGRLCRLTKGRAQARNPLSENKRRRHRLQLLAPCSKRKAAGIQASQPSRIGSAAQNTSPREPSAQSPHPTKNSSRQRRKKRPALHPNSTNEKRRQAQTPTQCSKNTPPGNQPQPPPAASAAPPR